jgi:hypothetical protein
MSGEPSTSHPLPAVLPFPSPYSAPPVAQARRSGNVLATSQELALGGPPDDVLDRLREMLAVVEQEDTARPALGDEGQEGRVGLGSIAVAAGDDQVVGSVVGSLPLPGIDMVECYRGYRHLVATVGADGSVSIDEPLPVGINGSPSETAMLGLWCGGLASAGWTWHRQMVHYE